MNIEVHIERLVLYGLPSDGGRAVGEGLKAELERLLALGSHPLAPEIASGGALPSVPGGTMHYALGGGMQELGVQIGRAIHSAISSVADRGSSESREGRQIPAASS